MEIILLVVICLIVWELMGIKGELRKLANGFAVESSLDSIQHSVSSIETWLETNSIEVDLKTKLEEIANSVSEIEINTSPKY